MEASGSHGSACCAHQQSSEHGCFGGSGRRQEGCVEVHTRHVQEHMHSNACKVTVAVPGRTAGTWGVGGCGTVRVGGFLLWLLTGARQWLCIMRIGTETACSGPHLHTGTCWCVAARQVIPPWCGAACLPACMSSPNPQSSKESAAAETEPAVARPRGMLLRTQAGLPDPCILSATDIVPPTFLIAHTHTRMCVLCVGVHPWCCIGIRLPVSALLLRQHPVQQRRTHLACGHRCVLSVSQV